MVISRAESSENAFQYYRVNDHVVGPLTVSATAVGGRMRLGRVMMLAVRYGRRPW